MYCSFLYKENVIIRYRKLLEKQLFHQNIIEWRVKQIYLFIIQLIHYTVNNTQYTPNIVNVGIHFLLNIIIIFITVFLYYKMFNTLYVDVRLLK